MKKGLRLLQTRAKTRAVVDEGITDLMKKGLRLRMILF